MVDGPLTEEEINELLAAYEELIAQIKEGKVPTLTRLPIQEKDGNCGSFGRKWWIVYPKS
ncbi:hypothetical protein [Neomoorella humiferrea]|uniref:Uncharacterized protein n=1 Tax=Neomoorella humiferrea TaxID=676965 RepID=A0A2T0AM29_9FIRM|nr:hypothetical protein [Moorella humiferrea]PRR69666.1 hypothetical protein MOHU_22950 [Moorella humiferrea]